jgi:putative solute:sodium symporter small subunit
MIEIVLGLAVILALLAMLAAAGGILPGVSAFDPLLLFGYGGIAGIVAAGLLLVAAGSLRRAIRRNPGHRHALRRARLAAAGCLAVAALAAGPAFIAELMNLVSLSGLPAGYHVAGEAALMGLVAVAFIWTARHARIDAEEDLGE